MERIVILRLEVKSTKAYAEAVARFSDDPAVVEWLADAASDNFIERVKALEVEVHDAKTPSLEKALAEWSRR
jgi:hypothetical protein